MGFKRGAIARLWSLDDKGKYSTGNMSISKKNGEEYQTNPEEAYAVVFQDGYVSFVGAAHEKAKSLKLPTLAEFRAGGYNQGEPILILDCDVTTYYDAKNQKAYTNYAVFDIELQDENGMFPSFNEFYPNVSRKSSPTKAKTNKASKKAAAPSEDEDENLGDSDLPF